MNADAQPGTKKRRRNGERVRVTRACDLCKRKKLKCSGAQPCALCAQSKQDCTFVSDYHRGKVPRISVTSADNETSKNAGDTDLLEIQNSHEAMSSQQGSSLFPMTGASLLSDSTEPLSPQLQTEQLHRTNSRPFHHEANTNITSLGAISNTAIPEAQVLPYTQQIGRSSRNSPEPTNTDQEGHYVGPASGVSFLSRALKKLHTNSQSSAKQTSIFNFADAPVPQYDPYFLMLPTRADCDTLIRRYFDFASPTHRYLHQPTVERWCEEFYNTIQSPKPLGSGAHERRAIILAVLAVAQQYHQSENKESHTVVNSAAFFAASEHHLTLESGGIRLTSIQARLVQCFHLLSLSRVNSAWSLFGTVANLVLALGLHRRQTRDTPVGVDLIEHECRKRVFWSAYTLDGYLSVGLGRPRSFHEEDLDQDLPLCVDDWQITTNKIFPYEVAGQSLTQASIYHAKLLRIVSGILRNLYGIKRPTPERQEDLVRGYDARLVQWHEELKDFLDIIKTEILATTFRRQHTVLNMAYSHAIILLHRQSLLMRSPLSLSREEDACQNGLTYSVLRCLDAATTIVKRLRDLVAKKQMYSAFWFTHYYVFSALVALYLFVVQSRSKAAHIWKPYLDLAQQGLRDLQNCSNETSYARRYVIVLTELQNEAIKPIEDDNLPVNTSDKSRQSSFRPFGNLEQNSNNSNAGVQPIVDAVENTPVLSQALQQIAPELDPQITRDSGNSNQQDEYTSTCDPWYLQDLETREIFLNLNVEGLADLAFMFSNEETNDFQAEKEIV